MLWALSGLSLFAGLPVPAQAASLDDEVWLAADLDGLFFFDEESLFGSGGLITEVEEGAGGALEEVLLVNDGVDVGGTYSLSLGADWAWTPDEGGPAAGRMSRRVDLDGSLFFDARPRRDFRTFAKIKGEAHLAESPVEVGIRLHELFADMVLGDRTFVRAGKQTIHWGVGYFFSPADIVNVGRLDPENPEAEREGPVAVRLHLPSGSNNLYAYAIVDGRPGDYRLALAPKAEFVLGRSEIGAGLYYRSDRAPRAMATLSTSAGRLSLFGEAVLSQGSDKRFVEAAPVTPANPLGLEVVRDRETVRFHATLGARASYSDPDGRFSLTGAAQYYYNGEGYDGDFSKAHRLGMLYLVQAGKLAASDILSPGRHYAAVSASGTSRSLKDVTPSAFWISNLSDGSGMFSLSLAYTGWKSARASVGVSRTYGDPGSEYATFGSETRLTVGVTIGGSGW